MRFLERSLEKLYNTIKYNGLYILLSILFPIMFYKIDAGREIVLFMLNPNQQYNISLIAFSFFLISISIWCIPVLAIDLFKLMTNSGADKIEIFQKIDRNYSGYMEDTITTENNKKITPQVPVYILSILPWIIFISNMGLVFFNRKIYFLGGIFICVFAIYFLKKILRKNKRPLKHYFWQQEKKKWIFFYICGFIFLLYFLLPILFNFSEKYPSLIILYYFIGLLLLYSFIFIYDFIRKLEVNYRVQPEPREGRLLEFNYRSSRLIHVTVLISVLALWITFYYFNRNASLGDFNPIVVSVVISCVLLLSLEFFILSQYLIIKIVGENTLTLKLYKFAVMIATLSILYLYFLSSPNNHLMRKENIANYNRSDYDRLKLEEYFQKWYDEKNKDAADKIKDKVFTVYLVSGQGGGSRAGAWFLMNMLYMDAKDKNFYNHVFSISTVSGSSSGANMYFALHQTGTNINSRNMQQTGNDRTSYNAIKNFTTNIYDKNYLSGGLFGLILNDFSLDAITNTFNDERRDRNYTLQKEELKAFEESYFKLFPSGFQNAKNESERNNLIADSLAKINTIRNYFEGDYFNMYQKNFSHPLFFLNATVIDDGTKGVFSPVKMDFSMFRDLYGDYRTCNASDHYALPMVACVNQSQAFPLMNAYNYLHGSGRLGDGGMYENSGTETTLEIYRNLRKYCDEKKINVEFVFINLMNSEIKGKQNSSFTKASYFNTISAMAKNPFYGHEFVAYKTLEKEITNKTDFISIIPQNSYTLTRMLSKATIDSLFNNIIGRNKIISDNALTKISPEYKSATTSNALDPLIKLETDSLYSVQTQPKIFIQYSGTPYIANKVKNYFSGKKKYKIQPLDYVPIENLKNSIRYFHQEDADLAKQILNEIRAGIKEEKHTRAKLKIITDLKNIEIINKEKEYPFVPKKQIEIWLAK